MGLFSAKPSENAKKIIDWLGCPCDYYPAGKSVQLIRSDYEEAFAKKGIGGYTPVMIVPDDVLVDQLDIISEGFSDGETPEQYRNRLLSGELPDAREWFTQTLTEMKSAYGDYWEQITEDTGNTGGKVDVLSAFIDLETKRCHEVILARIPTERPWEVFAWLPFGGWNDCPDAETMMSVGKHWHSKYGAVPAVITHDMLEFAARPVRDKSAAVGLALEQYAFCNDIIDQGYQELCVLADTLTKSSIWSFWWD